MKIVSKIHVSSKTIRMGIWLGSLLACMLIFSSYLLSAMVGACLAVVCYPLYKQIRVYLRLHMGRRWPAGLSRVAAALSTQMFVLLLVGLVAGGPAYILLRNRGRIALEGQAMFSSGRDRIRAKLKDFERDLVQKHVIEDLDAKPEGRQAKAVAQGETAVENQLRSWIQNPVFLLPVAQRTADGLVGVLMHCMVIACIMYFLLIYGRGLWTRLLNSNNSHWREHLNTLGGKARRSLRAIFLLQGGLAVAVFFLALPVFWLISPGHALLLSLAAGLLQLVPVAGSWVLVSVVAARSLAAGQAASFWTCLLVGFPFLFILPDFILRPWLGKKLGRIPALSMLLGVVVGLRAFGVYGFIFGPLGLDLFVCFTRLMLYSNRPGLVPALKTAKLEAPQPAAYYNRKLLPGLDGGVADISPSP